MKYGKILMHIPVDNYDESSIIILFILSDTICYFSMQVENKN